jgi:tetrahydromethanopterin S-methyltransferase subunit B
MTMTTHDEDGAPIAPTQIETTVTLTVRELDERIATAEKQARDAAWAEARRHFEAKKPLPERVERGGSPNRVDALTERVDKLEQLVTRALEHLFPGFPRQRGASTADQARTDGEQA